MIPVVKLTPLVFIERQISPFGRYHDPASVAPDKFEFRRWREIENDYINIRPLHLHLFL